MELKRFIRATVFWKLQYHKQQSSSCHWERNQLFFLSYISYLVIAQFEATKRGWRYKNSKKSLFVKSSKAWLYQAWLYQAVPLFCHNSVEPQPPGRIYSCPMLQLTGAIQHRVLATDHTFTTTATKRTATHLQPNPPSAPLVGSNNVISHHLLWILKLLWGFWTPAVWSKMPDARNTQCSSTSTQHTSVATSGLK